MSEYKRGLGGVMFSIEYHSSLMVHSGGTAADTSVSFARRQQGEPGWVQAEQTPHLSDVTDALPVCDVSCQKSIACLQKLTRTWHRALKDPFPQEVATASECSASAARWKMTRNK